MNSFSIDIPFSKRNEAFSKKSLQWNSKNREKPLNYFLFLEICKILGNTEIVLNVLGILKTIPADKIALEIEIARISKLRESL